MYYVFTWLDLILLIHTNISVITVCNFLTIALTENNMYITHLINILVLVNICYCQTNRIAYFDFIFGFFEFIGIPIFMFIQIIYKTEIAKANKPN